jgi:hypothetical protein
MSADSPFTNRRSRNLDAGIAQPITPIIDGDRALPRLQSSNSDRALRFTCGSIATAPLTATWDTTAAFSAQNVAPLVIGL